MSETLEVKLKKAEEKLKKLESEYQDFAYIIAHDLSAPLRAIEGFSSIILDNNKEKFDEKTSDHFERVIQSTKKCKSLLSAIIDFSQLSTSHDGFKIYDTNESFLDAKKKLSALIETHNAQIACVDLPKINAKRDQISLVFFHLLKNALTYQKPDTQPLITITYEDTKNHWDFIFKDNGIGLNLKNKDTIFQPFRRGVTDKAYAGIGIGLSIAKKIAENHDGTLELTHSDSTGSTFKLRLPKPHSEDI